MTAVGITFLAGTGWVLAIAVRHLLRRGIQITYLVPMSPKQEERMLHYVQLLAQWSLLGTAVYFATQADSAPGLSASLVFAGVMCLVLWRAIRPAKGRRETAPKHLSRPDDH
jgi:hypothetical protein